MTNTIAARAAALGSRATTRAGQIRAICRAVRRAPLPGTIPTPPNPRHRIDHWLVPDARAARMRPRDLHRMQTVRERAGQYVALWPRPSDAEWHKALRADSIDRRMLPVAAAAAARLGLWARDDAEALADELVARILPEERRLDHATLAARALAARDWRPSPEYPDACALARALALHYHRHMRSVHTRRDPRIPYAELPTSAWRYMAEQPPVSARWVSYDGSDLALRIMTGRGRRIEMEMPDCMAGISTAGCGRGDAYSLPSPDGTRIRYSASGRRRGVSMRIRGRWYRGADIAECSAKARSYRAAELLARLSTDLTVTREHARRVGACDPGIVAWLDTVGHRSARELPAREVLRLAADTRQPLAAAAAIAAAREAIQRHRALAA